MGVLVAAAVVLAGPACPGTADTAARAAADSKAAACTAVVDVGTSAAVAACIAEVQEGQSLAAEAGLWVVHSPLSTEPNGKMVRLGRQVS